MIAIRLKESDDLKQSICRFIAEGDYTSASVVSAVGSLSQVVIRMAGAEPDVQDVRTYEGLFEIVSLIGTVDKDGKAHLHISVSDKEGSVIGGHLKDGSIVHTTAEITFVTDPQLIFERKTDEQTGFDELYIEDKRNGN